jgi:hypothetical protein
MVMDRRARRRIGVRGDRNKVLVSGSGREHHVVELSYCPSDLRRRVLILVCANFMRLKWRENECEISWD